MKKQILSLLLAAVLVFSLAACGAPAEEATKASYTNDGWTLNIPEEYRDLVVVKTFENDPQGYLFHVSEKASIEAGKKQGHDESWSDGWLFSIGRVSDEFSKEMRCGDFSGAEFFAKAEDGSHFILYYPTDVRLVREDYSNIPEADMKQWSELNEWAGSKVSAAFIADNAGLEPEKINNSDLDVVFAKIAFQEGLKYQITTLEHGPMDPGNVVPEPFLDKLMNGVTYEYSDEQAPDGEYVVLSLPDEGVRYDFFIGDPEKNLVRRVYDDGYETMYKATFADGTTKITEVMLRWYDALVAAHDVELLGYKPDDFIGTWAEKIAGRGTIVIEKGAEDGTYDVTIEWSSSAAERAVWKMTAKAAGSNVLSYENGTYAIHTYTSENDFKVEEKYANGTGTFTLNSAFEIMWQDDIGHAGDDTVFINAKA